MPKLYPTFAGQKISPIWTMSSAEFAALVRRSTSVSEIIEAYGVLNPTVPKISHKTIYARVRAEGLDLSHIPRGIGHNRGCRRGGLEAVPLASVMVENSAYNRSTLKKRLIKEGILEEKCSICGIGNIWNGQPLVLIMDHINGDNTNATRENLRLVCPNCGSQLPTFGSRRFKGVRESE